MALGLQWARQGVHRIRKESFVNLRSLLIPLALTAPVLAQTAANRVAIIQFQAAVLSTQEGQQAQAALKTRFDPKKNELEKQQADLKAMQDKLSKGGATLAADVRARMEKDIASGTRSLNNAAEDLNSDVQEEENKLLQGMATKMGEIIRDYATKNGYSIVIDVSSQQSAVLWADPSANITEAIVKLYDAAHPIKGAAPAASKPPAATPPAATKPPAAAPPAAAKPPASKKQ
jgi:outer membrane protein